MKIGNSGNTNHPFFRKLCRRVGFAVAPVLVAAMGWPSDTCANVFDDFSDLDDTANPLWTHSDVGLGGVQTFDASAGNYRLQSTVGPFTFSYVGSFAESSSDFLISFDLLDWGSGAQKFGAYARATDINTFAGVDGYHFSYQVDNGQVLLRRMINANQAGQNLASTTYFLDDLKQYHFVFTGLGNTLIGRIYEIGGPVNPVVEIYANDTAFTSGLSGVLGFGVNAPTDFTIDNFTHLVPEPSTTVLTLLGSVVVGCSLLRRRVGTS